MRNPFSAQVNESLAEDRADRLRREFDEIDADHDKYLSFEEVHSFLSRRSGKPFDKQLCQELFAKMDKNSDDAITVEEFIRSYVDAEEMIKGRIDDLKQQINESEAHLAESQKQLAEAERTEEMNEFGVMKGSLLTVQVIEAKNLKTVGLTGTSNPSVVLMCGAQKIQTDQLTKTQAPHWDQAFTFSIEKGDADLKATVQSQGLLKNDFQGQVTIPLALVKDQMKHDAWFDLHGPKGNEQWQGSLHLGIQWIWSRKKYLKSIVEQWEDNISLDRQEVDHLGLQLRKLDEPFGLIETSPTTVPTKSSVYMGSVELMIDEKITSFAARTLGSDFNWDSAFFLAAGALIVLGSLCMYARADFPTVTTT